MIVENVEDDLGIFFEKEDMIDQDYKNGWRYIVWVGGNDDYYKKIADAKKDFEYWVDDGYDDVFHQTITKWKDGRPK